MKELMLRLWAVDPTTVICTDELKKIDPNCANQDAFINTLAGQVINTLSLVLGFAAVLMLIIAGIVMAVGGSNPDTTRKAKNAILYALIGIVIALSAQAIVRFVIGRVG